MNVRKIASVTGALALIFGMLLAGPVGLGVSSLMGGHTAPAADSGDAGDVVAVGQQAGFITGAQAAETCKLDTDYNTGPAGLFGPAQLGISAGQYAACELGNAFSSNDTDGLSETEKQQAYHTEAVGIADGEDTLVAGRSNYAQDIQYTAMSEARVDIFGSLNDGESNNVATTGATNAALEYVADRQENTIRIQEQQILQIKSLYETYSADSNDGYTANNWTVNFDYVSNADGATWSTDRIDSLSFGEKQVTLINGETVNVTTMSATGDFTVDYGSTFGSEDDRTIQFEMYDASRDGYTLSYNGGNDQDTYRATLVAKPPADFNDRAEVYNASQWYGVNQQFSETETYLNNNIPTLVDNTYSNYEAGYINASDVLTPTDLAREFATDYNGTGAYAAVWAQAALKGYNTDLNASVNVDTMASDGDLDGNVDVSGALFTRASAPTDPDNDTSGEWVVGTTYNSSNLDKPVYMAVQKQDGTEIRELTGEWSIVSAQNPDTGEPVDVVENEQYSFKSADNTDLKEQQDTYTIIVNTEEDRTSSSGGGGGGGDGGGLGDIGATPVLFVGAVVAGAYIIVRMLRDDD